MDYVSLGASGLKVSKAVLGTLTFSGTNGFEATGGLAGKAARKIVDQALDAGVNAIDTANLYSMGDAEKVLGNALKGRRDDALVFSKAGFPTSERVADRGATRRHLTDQIEQSLSRLQTDYLDLYFVHLWDGATPVEETVETMSGLVKAGKIRYWGVSNYSGWSLAKTAMAARAPGMIPPVAHQIYYTAEAREAELELLPAAADLGLTSMIWSPLAMGWLSGKIDRDNPPAEGTRQGAEGWNEPWVADKEKMFRVIDALKAVAGEHGVSVAQVALAWIAARPGVGPVVVGARNSDQLTDNLAAFDLELSDEQMAQIEQVGHPAPAYPHWHRAMHAADRATPLEQVHLKEHRRFMGL